MSTDRDQHVSLNVRSRVQHYTRKLYPSGEEGRSKVITVPFEWIRENNIQNSTDVHLLWIRDMLIIISPDLNLNERTEIEKMLEEYVERRERKREATVAVRSKAR